MLIQPTERASHASVVVITNLRSHLSLPVIRSLASSRSIELRRILFYDGISRRRPRIRKLISNHGLKAMLAKSTDAARLKFRCTLLKALKRSFFRTNRWSYEFALAKQIPFDVLDDLNAATTISLVKSIKPDLIVVCSCSQIFRPALISIPTRGCINIHPSLLPAYRGPLPVFWMLFNREQTAGITFHFMNESIDAGPITHQFEIPINGCGTESELTGKLFEEAGRTAEQVLTDILEKRITPRGQDLRLGTYYSFPTKEDRKKITRKRFLPNPPLLETGQGRAAASTNATSQQKEPV